MILGATTRAWGRVGLRQIGISAPALRPLHILLTNHGFPPDQAAGSEVSQSPGLRSQI